MACNFPNQEITLLYSAKKHPLLALISENICVFRYKWNIQRTEIAYQASRKECEFENYFYYFSTKTYIVGTQNDHLIPPQRDGSFEHPKQMFKMLDKKIILD